MKRWTIRFDKDKVHLFLVPDNQKEEPSFRWEVKGLPLEAGTMPTQQYWNSIIEKVLDNAST